MQASQSSSSRVREPLGTGWPLLLAVLSLGAALIHAAAVSSHSDHVTLSRLFAATALAQGAWALAVVTWPVTWPRRPMLWAGLAINALALGAYLASRTVGVPIDGLETVEAVGLQDLVCALLEGFLVGSIALLLAPRTILRSYRTMGLLPAAVGIAVVSLVSVPALAAGHGGSAGHDHGDAVAEHDHGEAAQGHDHGDAGAGHDHASTGESVSAASEARADALVTETEEGLQRWSDYKVAEADGFVSIGDGRSGFEHYINREFSATPETLDADHPESLVYAVNADGSKQLVSAMYIAEPGTSMDDVPDVAGAPWHTHDNLCWDDSGQRLAGILINGRCTPGGTLRVTAPMLHVWIVPNECGPFAGLENSSSIRGSASSGAGGLAAQRGLTGDAAGSAEAPNCAEHGH